MLTLLSLEELLKFDSTHYTGEGHFVTIDSHQYPFVKGFLKYPATRFKYPPYCYGDGNIPAAYILQEINTGQRYFGSSAKIYKRIIAHRSSFTKKKHHNHKLSNLIQKSDSSNFELIIIFTGTRDKAYDVEQLLISLFKDSETLLNLAYDARYPQLGKKLTDGQKRAISLANTGKKKSDKEKIQMSIFQRTSAVCIAHRKRMIELNKRKIMVYGTEYNSMADAVAITGINRSRLENRLKIKDSGVYWTGTNVSLNKGIRFTTDHCKRISESKRKDPKTYENIKKLQELMSRKIILDGVLYISLHEAADKTGISRKSIYRQLLKNKQQLPDGTYVLNYKKHLPKKVIIDGVVYDSVKRASEILSINLNTLQARIRYGLIKYYQEGKPEK